MLQYSPKIITDSLVMCLDASHNKSYPTDLPVKNGLNLWLDASDDSTFSYSSGTLVSQWRDKSGSDFHASQATVGSQPSRSTFQNSRKTVNFDGTNDTVTIPSFVSNSEMSIFVVSNCGTSMFIEQSIDTNFYDGFAISGLGTAMFIIRRSSVMSYIFNTNWLSGGYSIASAVNSTGLDLLTYKNGTQQTIITDSRSSITNSYATNTLYIGSRAASSLWSSGPIAEIIIYNRKVTDVERNLIHTYLGQKWGISNTDRQVFDLSGNNFNFSFNGTNPRYNAKSIVSNFNTTSPFAVSSYGGQNLTSTLLNLLYIDHTIEVAVNLKGFKAVKSFDNARDYEGAAGIVLWQGYHSGLYVDAATEKLTYLIWNATPDFVAIEYALPNDLKDKILYITAKRQANVLSLFINGLLVAGPTSIITTVRSYSQINIGAAFQGDPSSGTLGGFVWAGQHEYHLLRMYSRALDASELVSNYQAFKARFDNNVVRYGLVLDLDAGNPYSYAGAGTTWYDVSGNGYQATMSNLTSANWVSYNGVRTFETNDTNDQGFRITSFPFPASRTYEIWINSKSFSLGWQTWFDDGGGERILFGTSTNTVHVYPDLNFTANLTVGTWYQLVYTLANGAGSACIAYVNGVSIGSGTYNSTIATSGTLYILGDSGSEITSCYCALARIYNRALSASEVLQNYNATKGRFGL